MKPVATILKNFFLHDDLFLAANISFYALLSIVPIILIIFSLVGFFLGSSQEVYHQLVTALADLLPQVKVFLLKNLNEVVGQRRSFGVVGLVFLIFIATLLFGAIEKALDVVFATEKKRNFFHSRLIAIALIGFISFFFFLPTAADLFTRGLTHLGLNFPLGVILRGKLFFMLLSFVSFVLVVFLIPHHRVRWKYVLFGGAIFALGIFIAKHFFRWYFLWSFARYNVIYGSLTAFVLLVLWIFYVANILLFSAEVVAYLQVRHSQRVANQP
ncbi:MAG: YihY/virulence factor BrkB family protein [Deltaproteobacteria bacterium]|nr:YihY/virulence factor BrkB family protein [Deltaproteobacteria bacterium]